jgi:DNA-binding transcriptional ArsR family regulator
MSWHVRILRNAGIVTTRRHGRQVFCSLDRQNIAALQARFNTLVNGWSSVPEPTAAPVPLPSS